MIFPSFTPKKATAAPNFADGEYSIPFTVLKDTSNEQSTAADYMVSPAKVIVQNGKTHVVMTLTNSSWWQYFKVQSGGGFSSVQVLGEDTVNDKRVVKFEVKDIEQVIDAKVHVIVTGIPGFNYDNKYDIRFKFNSKSIPLASVAEKPITTPKPIPTPTPKPTPAPIIKPSESEKAVATPSAKPSETKTEKKQETAAKTEEKQETVMKTEKKQETAMKTEEKIEPLKEAVSEKLNTIEVVKEETSTEATEQPAEEVAVTTNDEKVDAEEAEAEESAVETKEQVVEEIEAEKISKSNSGRTMIIILLSVVVLGGLLLLVNKKRSRIQK